MPASKVLEILLVCTYSAKSAFLDNINRTLSVAKSKRSPHVDTFTARGVIRLLSFFKDAAP
jgi:hypothetical protein